MRLSLGIDLGTTNSVVATNAQVLSLLEGDIRAPLLPSAVAFLPDGGAVVGAAARERKPIDPKNTVYASKRLMGEDISSSSSRAFQLQYPHDIEACPEGGVQFVTRAGPVRPADIAALIASHLCMRAMFHPDKVATVVTVPSGFRQAARLATVRAIRQAGFTDLRLLDEPVATAVAYLHRANLRYAAVYDLGGGTFDFAVIDCSKFPFRIIGHSGDPYLGGDDIDGALADIVSTEILKQSSWDLKSDPITYARLMLACEQAKCALALDESTPLDIASIDPAAPPDAASFSVTRDMLLAASTPLIQRTFGICDEVLAEAQLKARDVQAVFMAGGSTRLYNLHAMVNQYFGRRLRVDLNPEHVVALGASMVAARPELWPLLDPGLSMQFKIYGLRSFLERAHGPIGDVVHAAAMRTLQAPADKRFQRFIALEDWQLVKPADRSERYLVIEVILFTGRTLETRKALVRALMDDLARELSLSPNDIEVVLLESPREHWGIRGQHGDDLQLPYKVDV